MIHLGDITKIKGSQIPPVDVIIGGSPCQDLSIAGNRKGLQGERSGLFMEQIRIIKEMRDTYGTAYPRYMVWENVPGALSSNKGEDFRVVIEETVGIVEPGAIVPRPEKWRTSGVILGNGWSIAWRILDAQFWGVPQRRRRIALIADFGGHSAPEILFVRKSVSGDIAQSGTQRERASSDAESGTGKADNSATYCLQGNMIDRADTAGCNGKGWTEDVSYTLNTVDRPATYAAGFKYGQSEKARSIGYQEECSPTLNGESGGNQIPTVAVLPFNTTQITSNQNGNNPKFGDPCHTLNATDHPPAIIFENHGQDSRYKGPLDVCPMLPAQLGTGGNNTPLVMAHGQANAEIIEGLSPTLNCNHEQPIVCAVDCRNGIENPDVNGTLQAKSNGGTSYNLQNTIRANQCVRRLTPLECERLQGYPDGWTDIGEWTDSKGKKRQTTDSARYRALGNSIALPPWKWVLKRLCACYERDATMGSLFDGIGGFPLIWEQLNGKGSCLWVSEIEEFCIAVTKKHFGN